MRTWMCGGALRPVEEGWARPSTTTKRSRGLCWAERLGSGVRLIGAASIGFLLVAPTGFETRATSLKGWRPGPLDDRATL